MALNWSSVKPEHVSAAFELLADKATLITKRHGLVVRQRGAVLPAKEVLRVAHRLANALPRDAEVNFSSGNGTLSVLRRLGFEAERIDPSTLSG
jgi:hypothetical protein